MRIALILLMLSWPLGILAQPPAAPETRIEKGRINGAEFRIEIPAGALKGLVIYCHGYQLAALPYGFDSNRAGALRQVFLARGFAVAESAYARQGWAIKEAVEDTEALRRFFVANFGEVKETIVLGHSMGLNPLLLTFFN